MTWNFYKVPYLEIIFNPKCIYKIYIPTLWPNVLNGDIKDSIEFRLADNILPLPCDQRYVDTDIFEIIQEVCKYV